MLKPRTKQPLIRKKTIYAESRVLAQLVRSEAGCLAHHGTPALHTLSLAIFAL